MPDYYFTNVPDSPHGEKTLTFTHKGQMLRFVTDAGTFSRERVDPGSELLLSAVESATGSCADVGCGWGAIGLSLAKTNPASSWLLIDVNVRAAELARRNAAENDISNARIQTGDGLSGIDGAFSLIVTNPPIRAGNDVVRRIFKDAHARLDVGGRLFTVVRKKQGAASTKTFLEELFGNCEVVARGGGYRVMESERT